MGRLLFRINHKVAVKVNQVKVSTSRRNYVGDVTVKVALFLIMQGCYDNTEKAGL